MSPKNRQTKAEEEAEKKKRLTRDWNDALEKLDTRAMRMEIQRKVFADAKKEQ